MFGPCLTVCKSARLSPSYFKDMIFSFSSLFAPLSSSTASVKNGGRLQQIYMVCKRGVAGPVTHTSKGRFRTVFKYVSFSQLSGGRGSKKKRRSPQWGSRGCDCPCRMPWREKPARVRQRPLSNVTGAQEPQPLSRSI